VISAILAALILKEPWESPELLATFISIIGAILVIKPKLFLSGSSSLRSLGIVYALLAALGSGAAYITVRMLGTSHKMPWSNVCFAQSLGQIFLSIPCLYLAGQNVDFNLTSHQYMLIVAVGVIGSLSQVAMTIGMQREKSATATAMRMSDILFGFIWQVLFTADAFDIYSVIGNVLKSAF